MNRHSQNWRAVVLLFSVAALAFAVAGPFAERMYSSLIHGPAQPAPTKTRNSTKKAAAKPRTPAVPSTWESGMLCLHTAKPPVIDGKANDWDLRAGVLRTADYAELCQSASVWFYTAFDDRAFYIFSRVRDPLPFNDQAINQDPTSQCVIQVRLKTDRFRAINVWDTESGDLMVQMHDYVMNPKNGRDKTVAIFPTRDTRNRHNGAELGITAASTLHADGKGYNAEIAVPWTVLCHDATRRPRAGDRVQAMFAARLSMKNDLGQVVAHGGRDPGKLDWLWFVSQPPARPLLPKIQTGKNQYKYLTLKNDPKTGLPSPNTSSPIFPYRPLYRRLVVPPATHINVDGDLSDWPRNAGAAACYNLRAKDVAQAWFYPAYDATALYLAASISDPTPLTGGDRITLSIQSNKLHKVELTPGNIHIDGMPGQGKAILKPWINGKGYDAEAMIPWSAITPAPSRPTTDVRISTSIAMNPHWVIHGLGDFTQAPDGPIPPERGALLQFVNQQPALPIGIPVANSRYLPIAFDDSGRPKIQQRGFLDLSPHAVTCKEIDVIPGKARIDGKADEWDLSGGVFLCKDTRVLRDAAAYWLHLMYDDKYLYALGRITDHSPLSHCGKGGPWGDDIFTIRINYGQVGHYHAWRKPPKMNWDIIVQREHPHRTLKKNQLPKGGHGILNEATKLPDGSGYIQEMAIPWKLINPAGKPPKPGTRCPLEASIRVSRDYAVDRVGNWPGVAGFWWDNKYWGTAIFRNKGHLTPRPVQLINGTVLPVTLENGMPVVDFSQVDAE